MQDFKHTTYFDVSKLQPVNSFVLMLDIMGTQNTMSQSLQRSANFVFKFHSALMMHKTPNASICPIMDGAYIAVENRAEMRTFIHDALYRLCNDFVNAHVKDDEEKKHLHQYMVRGSLAYGQIIAGRTVPKEAFDPNVRDLPEWKAYADSLIIGAPVIQAYSIEKSTIEKSKDAVAPPFGIYIHESARAPLFPPTTSASSPFRPKWYKWWDDKDPEDVRLLQDLKTAAKKYFGEYEKHPYSSGYLKSKIDEHQAMFDDYFSL